MLKAFLSLFFPDLCLVCRKPVSRNQDGFCKNCQPLVGWIHNNFCSICQNPFTSKEILTRPCGACLKTKPFFDAHRTLAIYDGPLKKIIHQIKYGNKTELVSILTHWILKKHASFFNEIDYLIPIPMTKKRLRERSYNQALLMAQKLGKKTGIPVLPHSLIKIKETIPQSELNGKKRRANLKDCFAFNDKINNIKNKKVILVDDVFTTGSTFNQAASILRHNKASWIGAISIAIAPLQR